MGKLLDLLKSAAGEAGLHNALGRWRQAVSSSLDSVTGVQYAYGKSGAGDQVGIGTGTNLEIPIDGLMNGIIRSPGNPTVKWILSAGKVYQLLATGWFDTFSDDAAGQLIIRWVDDGNTPLNSGTADAPQAFFRPTTRTVADGGASVVGPFLYQPPDDPVARTIALRCTGGTGTAVITGTAWSVSIVEIPNGA